MPLDLIHDVQIAYRKVVDSMSRPGLISNVCDQANKVEMEIGCFPSTLLLAMMLLDIEVTFKVFSQREAEITRILNQLTYAHAVEAEQAQFIFVLMDAEPADLQNALAVAKNGDFVNPQDSATIIVEADAVSNDGELILTGPGIDEQASVHVATRGDWIDIRRERNVEYPLGVDLIFNSPDHQLLCLLRTTQILTRVVR